MSPRFHLKLWLLTVVIGCAACSPDTATPPAPTDFPTPEPTTTPHPSQLPLTIHNADSVVPLMMFDGSGSHYALAWSPDGQRIAAGGSARDLYIYDLRQRNLAAVAEGHFDYIEDVTADGDRWISASWDGSLRSWDRVDGTAQSSLDGVILDKFWAADWSTQGLFAVSDETGIVRVLNFESGEQVSRWQSGSGNIGALCFSPDGDTIAVSVTDERVYVRRVVTGEIVATFETGLTSGNAHALAWSPDGSKLATGGREGSIYVWDVETGEQLAELIGHWDDVSAMAWSPNASLLATGGNYDYHQLILWDTDSWVQVSSFDEHEDRIRDIAWSPEGNRFASVDPSTKLIVWGLPASLGVTPQGPPHLGTQAETFEAYEDFVTDIRALALESYDFNITLKEKGTYRMTIPSMNLGEVLWQMGWCTASADLLDKSLARMDLRFVIDGEMLSADELLTQIVRSSGDDICQWVGVKLSDWPFGEHVLRMEIVFNEPIDDSVTSVPYPAGETVWEFHVFSDRGDLAPVVERTAQDTPTKPETGTAPNFLPAVVLEADGDVWGISWSPDGRSLAGSLYTGGMIVWDVESGNRWPPIIGDDAVWFSDGSLLAIDARFEVDIMDGNGGVLLRSFDPGELLLDLKWSPVDRILALAQLNDVVSMWDVDSGDRIGTFENETWGDLSNLAWSPDGSTLALTGRGIFLIDPEDGSPVQTFSDYHHPAWSPDGTRIAAESRSGLVVLNVETGATIFDIPMEFSRVHGPTIISWSPNGSWIATANDLEIDVWDAATGEPVVVLRGHEDRVNAVQFSPDGAYLASSSKDTTIILWGIDG